MDNEDKKIYKEIQRLARYCDINKLILSGPVSAILKAEAMELIDLGEGEIEKYKESKSYEFQIVYNIFENELLFQISKYNFRGSYDIIEHSFPFKTKNTIGVFYYVFNCLYNESYEKAEKEIIKEMTEMRLKEIMDGRFLVIEKS